jgi:amino acid adenylation domain-containing protein
MIMSDPHVSFATLPKDKRAALELWLLNRLQVLQPAITPISTFHSKCRALSLAQESLWFFDQRERNNPLYNIPEALRLTGPLNVGALEKSLQAVYMRQDALRTRFLAVDGKPMQVVESDASFSLRVIDLSGLGELERSSELAHRIQAEATMPFDLGCAPMWRVQLLKLSGLEHVLLLTLHHIISDHTSILLLHKEIEQLYAAFANGQAPEMPVLQQQFSEFAENQRQRMSSNEEHLAFWRKELAGDIPVLDLPADFQRPNAQTFKGARKKVQFPSELLQELKEFSRKQNATLYVTLLAAFQALLHRYTNQEEVVVGAPVSSRTQSKTEKLIGYFINVLPVRSRVTQEVNFSEFLGATRQTMLNILAHQEISIERMVEELRVPRYSGRNPIFQAVFQFLPSPMPELKLPGISCEVLDVESGTSKFELTLTLGETDQGLCGDLEYNTDLFARETIDRMVASFGVMLRSVVASPTMHVASLPLITEEGKLLLAQWNDTKTDYPDTASIGELFERQVSELPDAIAVIEGDRPITYRELNARANQLARYLQKQGVGPDVMVGFCVERSIEMIVGLLGILKAGGAYVTLDASYPPERLKFMFEDTAAPVFVTTSKFKQIANPETATICLDEDQDALEKYETSNVINGAMGENIAYVTYTSGSTGKPKGVLVTHKGVVRLVKNTNYLKFGRDDVFLQFAPISFDASTLEIWGPLLNGGRLVMFPRSFDSLQQLASVISKSRITTLWLTSGIFHQMVEEQIGALKEVRFLLAGGDVLSVAHVTKALRELPNTQLINGYGPTENTTFTCCYLIPQNWTGTRSVPIGRPISNTQVHILDAQGQRVPVGVVGELYIGGDGLAREYLNAPDLTAAKFVRSPFGSTQRLYRTGDLARWMPDGNVEFIGRIDNQVKVRGFRIELSEVEAALLEHEMVQQVVVVTRRDSAGVKQLIAYVVPKPGIALCTASVRNWLDAKLPNYMVPSALIPIESIPLTENGKVDRRKLPEPVVTSEQPAAIVPPRNAVEAQIAQIWKDVLGREDISIHDNFFALGGHSLLATRIVSRVSSILHKDAPIRMVFECPTIEKFAQEISRQETMTVTQDVPITRRRRRIDGGAVTSSEGVLL